jgi:hypothetical protein
MTKKKRKGKRTNNDIQNIEQKTIYIEQDEAHWKPGVILGAPEG